MSAAAAFALAAAFNLVCTGTTTTGTWQGMDIKDKKEEPFSTVLRVDLTSQRWCEGECRSTIPIQRVSDTEILFVLEETPSLGLDHVRHVSRETGAYIDRMRAGGFILMNRATCEKAEFTGFPIKRF